MADVGPFDAVGKASELQPVLSPELAAAIAGAKDYAASALSDNTVRSYASDWRDFTAFCERHGLVALPATPQTIAVYITTLADSVKPATIERRFAAIGHKHRNAGVDDPCLHARVRTILRGIFRRRGAPAQAKAPITDTELYPMLRAVEYRPAKEGAPHNEWERTALKTARDRAVLLLGFAGAFRRSELVALDIEDLAPHTGGLLVTVRGSKTDQKHEGLTKAIPRADVSALDPVGAVEAWCERANIASGALFRSFDRAGRLTDRRLGAGEVARILKGAAQRAGLDPVRFAGHSLRSGFLTAGGRHGVPIPDLAAISHQSLVTVLHYWKAGAAFEDPPLLRIFGVDAGDT